MNRSKLMRPARHYNIDNANALGDIINGVVSGISWFQGIEKGYVVLKLIPDYFNRLIDSGLLFSYSKDMFDGDDEESYIVYIPIKEFVNCIMKF